MDYNGTRETESEVALGDAALARSLPELASAATASARTGGIPLVPDASNTIVLPEGATLDDISVRGRDLVIQLEDGRTYVVADGAVFVPQIVAEGVTVPPLNLAALLIGNEPEPAAGPIRSSGGNFAVPVDPLQAAYDIGDLLPYTELSFSQPRQREIFPFANNKPVTGPNAEVQLDDDALAGGNPGGTGDDVDSANTTGTLSGSGGDGALTWSLSTEGAPDGFSYVANGDGIDVFQGAVKVLSITLDPVTGAYTVSQLAPIMHAAGGDENNQLFTLTYQVTDIDGDTASGTLAINVDDDTPVAANDTDTIDAGSFGPATGNVLTDASAGDAGDGDNGADHVGADGGLTLTAISGFGGAGVVDGLTVGQYGELTLNADGSYSYVRNPGTPGGVTDTFTYTIRDADGDTATATLTITIEDAQPVTAPNAVVQLDDDALAGGNPGGTGDDANALNTSGTLAASGGDGPLTWSLSTTGAPAGFSYVANGTGVDVYQGATLVLQVTLNTATGGYSVTQVAPILHAPGGDENNQLFTLTYQVTDIDGDPANGTLTINVDDDTPVAYDDFDTIASGSSEPATGNVITDAEGDGGADSVGADAPGTVTAITGFGGAGTVEGTTIGQYGVLTIHADGSYSYVRNAGTPGNVSDSFTYTLTDSDGDSTTATLTIMIEDARPYTTPNAVVLLDDDALAGGNPGGTGDDTPDTANLIGMLSGAGGDGALTWAISSFSSPGGFSATLVTAGLLEIHQGATLVMTITLDPATGAYTVTQNAPILHAPGGDENNVNFTLGYTVTDADGDPANGTLTINVDDDTPVAYDDADTIASGSYGPATGNVITDAEGDGGADSAGADGGLHVTAITGFGGAGAVDGLTVGQYGQLTLNADGSYSYVRNAGTPGGVTDTFTYTVTDADGDPATATLTITIEDALPITAPNAVVQLDDDALAGGNPGGTGDDANAVNTSGTLAASGGDGPLTWSLSTTGAPAGFSYVANGTGVDVYQGATLVLQVTLNTATGGYSVTQVAPILHAPGGDENNAIFTLGYTVTDVDGDPANGTLTINVDDDTPVAVNDIDSVTEDGPLTADGNVLTGSGGSDANATDGNADSIGADGPAVGGAVTGVAFGAVSGAIGVGLPGAYGTLTLGNDGTYSYVLNNANAAVQALDDGETLSEVFTYTITDADGDSTTATLTITINGANDAPVVTPSSTAVSEEGLVLSNPDTTGTPDTTNSSTATGTIVATDVDGDTLSFTLGTPTPALTSGGEPIVWTGMGTGTLTGSAGGVPVITVTIDGNGGYTVTLLEQVDHPVAGVEDSLTLTVPVNVSDGTVTTPTTLTVAIEDDSPTAQMTTTSGTVDEDGLAGGIAGGIGDVAGTATTASGSVTALFSDGADRAVHYGLSADTSSLPALTSGGVAVTYAVVGNVLTASAGGTPVFTLTLNATTGAWDFALLQPLDHAPGNAENDIVLQFATMVSATDYDGDSVTATGTFSITIDDDTPIANNDSIVQATENAPVTIDVFGNDLGGADGASASSVTLVGGSLTGSGVLVNNGNGTFTYTPSAGETGTVTFQYTITDHDGDVATATATITLLPDSVPQVVNAVAAVDDDGLAGGNPLSTTGDIDANAGEPGATPSEAIYSGSFSVNFGGDTGTVSFANLDGTTGTVGTETVNYSWNALNNTLTATGPRGALFTVSLSPSGAYTVTLLDNVLHTAGGNETSTVVTLNYLAADSDGDSSTAGTLAITFNDDAPTLGIIQNQQVSNDPGQTPAVGTLHFAAGADGAGAAMTIGANLDGLTSNGHTLVGVQAGNIFTAYADNNNNGVYDSGTDTAVFTLTVDPNAGTSGQYVFDLIAPLDTATTNVSILSDGAFGSGPSSGIEVTNSTTGELLTLVTGWAATGGFTGTEEADWLAGMTPDMTQRTDVNGSTSGWGLQNNNFDAGEFLRFDFGVLNDYDGAGGYTPPVAGPYANVSYASFSFFNFGTGDTIEFVAHFTNGTTQSYVLHGGVDPSTLTINAPNGLQIAWIDVYEATGSIKLNLTDIGVTSTTIDETIPFTLQLTDGDGDTTAAVDFSVHVGTSLTPFAPAVPLAIDLDGDGVEFLSLAGQVGFDYAGDGQTEGTAWVAPDDGLLAIDANGNGKVDGGSEIVFGGAGVTDLAGLAATYDSDHNGVLDARDEAFAQFGVWQDADSDGVSDPGEFHTLTELGIVSISLTSDNDGYVTANGDVEVFGSTTYTRTDGTTGVVADAAFATAELQRQPAELAAVSAAASGLLAAMALDHANVAAHDGLQIAAIHTADLPVAALSLVSPAESPETQGFAQQPAPESAKAQAVVDTRGFDAASDEGHLHADLGKASDHETDQSATAADAGKSALFDFSDNAHSAMDALLTIAGPAPTNQVQAAGQPQVAEALADASAHHAVDGIVDYFAAGSAGETVTSHRGGDFALQGLLNVSVEGTGHDGGASHFNLMQALDHEQAAALA